jgi:hypothetical protein
MIVNQKWFCRYPRPRAAIFDNSTEFSSEFLELLRSYGVSAKPITIENLQTNAFVERIQQVIGDAISTTELRKQTFDETSINAMLHLASAPLLTLPLPQYLGNSSLDVICLVCLVLRLIRKHSPSISKAIAP